MYVSLPFDRDLFLDILMILCVLIHHICLCVCVLYHPSIPPTPMVQPFKVRSVFYASTSNMVLECLIIVLDSLGKYTPILCASLLNCKVPGGRHSRGAVTEDGPEVLCQPNLLGVPIGETRARTRAFSWGPRLVLCSPPCLSCGTSWVARGLASVY